MSAQEMSELRSGAFTDLNYRPLHEIGTSATLYPSTGSQPRKLKDRFGGAD